MRRTILLLVLLLFVLPGCKNNTANLPPACFNEKEAMPEGNYIYEIYSIDKNEKIGEATIIIVVESDLLKISESIKNAILWLDKTTLKPVKFIGNYKTNDVLTFLEANFFEKTIQISIEESGKTRQYNLKSNENTYPDESLPFLFSGFNFEEKEAYIYDYHPYTSLFAYCSVYNLGKEQKTINNKKVEVFHIVLGFSKKKRDLYYTTDAPHILVERCEENIYYIIRQD
ncbi:MAG: hypothetical protein U9Q18_01850 [Caldisericota bacterium]|nr:hypothetical protein [Caldisericota bacterium]